jgi:hypothetical protein
MSQLGIVEHDGLQILTLTFALSLDDGIAFQFVFWRTAIATAKREQRD